LICAAGLDPNNAETAQYWRIIDDVLSDHECYDSV